MVIEKLFVEAVSVCVGYSDYLREVAPHNLMVLDDWAIVTTPDDVDTHRVCKQFGIRFLPTGCMHRDVAPPSLNKSRAINYGLANLSQRGWVVHLDADIMLPPQFRRMAENAELDPSCLYGMDRVNCRGARAWDAYRANPEPQFEWSYLMKPPRGMDLGARIAHVDYGGYCPLGFFQMWNPKASGVGRYPVQHQSDMEHTDILFSIQWDRRKRVLFPDGFCLHLESEDAKFGSNWAGRRTAPFRDGARADSPKPPKSDYSLG